MSIYRPQLENLLGNEARSGLTASPLRSHTTAAKARSKKRQGRREDSEYGEESSYDDGMEPSVGPGIEHSGRLSPAPHDGNGMADLMTTTTSAPSPRRTRRARMPTKLEDDGTFDEEVSGRQPAKPTWSIPPVQPEPVAQLQPYRSDLLTKTFVQCENMECGKWRKVPVSCVDQQGRWVCAMNPDPRCCSLIAKPFPLARQRVTMIPKHLALCVRPWPPLWLLHQMQSHLPIDEA